MPVYEFTCDFAKIEPPPPEMQQLMGAMQGNQGAMDDFVSVMAGTLPAPEFFGPRTPGASWRRRAGPAERWLFPHRRSNCSTPTGGRRTTCRSGQIYLLDNPLLREPLRPEHIKPRLLGHWGTTPGPELHLRPPEPRRSGDHDLDAIYVTGPGHGGPAVVANA